MTSTLNRLQSWQPGCWCAGMLKLCDTTIIEEGEKAVRYPEQWLFVLWRPQEKALPYLRPDCWGLSVGDPRSEIASSSHGEPVYVLSEYECLWSAWLNIALNCEQHEPWLMEHICAARDRQIIAEKSSNIAWYGNDEQEFQRFLRRLTYEK